MKSKITVTLNSRKLAQLAASGLALRHPEYHFGLKEDGDNPTLLLQLEGIEQTEASEAYRLGIETKIWDFLI